MCKAWRSYFKKIIMIKWPCQLGLKVKASNFFPDHSACIDVWAQFVSFSSLKPCSLPGNHGLLQDMCPRALVESNFTTSSFKPFLRLFSPSAWGSSSLPRLFFFPSHHQKSPSTKRGEKILRDGDSSHRHKSNVRHTRDSVQICLFVSPVTWTGLVTQRTRLAFPFFWGGGACF